MRTTRSAPSSLRLFRQCLLLGFLLTPVMAVGQEVPDFEFTLLVAESGVPEGQYNLSNMYANGRGVPEDDAVAARWFRLAADQVSNRIINEIPKAEKTKN